MSLINPKTASGAVHIAATDASFAAPTNQLVFGTGINATINVNAPAVNRTFSVVDVGADADFVMTGGTQTITGKKNFDVVCANQINIGTTTPAVGYLFYTQGKGKITDTLEAGGLLSNSVEPYSGSTVSIASAVGETLSTANLTAGTISAGTGIVDSGLTGSQAVATDVNKKLVSIPYTTTGAANSLIQTDASGNIIINNLSANNITAPGTGSFTLTTAGAGNITVSAGGTLSLAGTTVSTNALTVSTVLSTGALKFTPNVGAQGFIIYPQTADHMSILVSRSSLNTDAEFGVANGAGAYFTNTAAGDIVVRQNNATNKIHFGFASSASAMYLDGSNGYLTFPNYGVRFGTSGALLDVYTGSNSYTPTMGDGTNSFTMSTAVGRYNRIGSTVCFMLRIAWTGKGSANAGSAVKVSLPYGVGPNWARASFSIGYGLGIVNSGTVICGADTNSTAANIRYITTTGSITDITCGSLSTTGEIQVSGVYDLG